MEGSSPGHDRVLPVFSENGLNQPGHLSGQSGHHPGQSPDDQPDPQPSEPENDDQPPLVPERRCAKCCGSDQTPRNGLKRPLNGPKFNILEKEANASNTNNNSNSTITDTMQNMSLTPEPPDKSPRDDMNGYFQANLHLLEYLSNDGRHEGGGQNGNGRGLLYQNLCDNQDYSSDEEPQNEAQDYVNNIRHGAPEARNSPERYKSLDGYRTGAHGFHEIPHGFNPPPSAPDLEDQDGDFIETDIVPNAFDFLNSDNSDEFSDEENQRKDAVYEMLNLNHDRHKKEMDKIVETTQEDDLQSSHRGGKCIEPETSHNGHHGAVLRPSLLQDIPASSSRHPESLSLWSPEIEYPELEHPLSSDQHHQQEQNDLNEVFSSEASSDHEDEQLFNVSRQTSTSNFDNDENNFQGEDCDEEDLVGDHAGGYHSDQAGYHGDQAGFHGDQGGFHGEQAFHGESGSFQGDQMLAGYHCKRRASEGDGTGPYGRLLDYDPSTSDEEDLERPVEEVPVYPDVDQPSESDEPTSPVPGTDAPDSETNQSRPARKGKPPLPKVMVWSEYEAYISQVKQIGRSACGPTAVINVLKAFDVFCDKEKIKSAIISNLRAEKAPLPEYLFSRSVAGTTAAQLVEGIMKLTDGAIYGRFFRFHPRRKVDLTRWLGYWISKGAVPMVTLNLQKAVPPGWVTPDAWHHQMVYGVGPKGVYLTNPLEILPVPIIEQQLCSDRVLLVRRSDVASRWTDQCDLGALVHGPDTRWTEFNVLGQVVSVLREASVPGFQGYKLPWASHIRIPCMYESGVSLFVKADSDSYTLLTQTEQLPLDDGTDTSKT